MGQAPQADGRGSRALTALILPDWAVGQRRGLPLSPVSVLSTAPSAVRLENKGAVKGPVEVEEPIAIFNFL